MKTFNKITIKSDSPSGIPTHVEIDGIPVRARKIKYEVEAGSDAPLVTLELVTPEIDIDVIAKIDVIETSEETGDADKNL